MNTNQTIDGVPRELLERVTHLDEPQIQYEARIELRALLDAPVHTPLLGGGSLEEQPEWAQIQILKNTVEDLKGDIEKLQADFCAQPQGVPVAIERLSVQMLKGGLFRLDSDPDGPLVRYQDHAAQVEILRIEVARLNRVKLALAEKVSAHADNCAVYRAQLAEQTAPVAVAPCKHCGWPHLNDAESCDDATLRERGKP